MYQLVAALGLVFLVTFSTISLQAESSQLEEFSTYKSILLDEFQTFKRIHEEESKKYQQELKQYWDDPEFSSKTTWIQYTNNNLQKSRVDFERGEIIISRVQKSGTPKKDIKQAVIDLLKTTKQQAFNNDKLSQSIEERSINEVKNIKTGNPSNESILAPHISNKNILTDKEIGEIAEKLLTKKRLTKKTNSKQQKVISLHIPLSPIDAKAVTDKQASKDSLASLPSKAAARAAFLFSSKTQRMSEDTKSLPQKAKKLERSIHQYSNQRFVATPLVFALIEAESAFNPLAKSHIPAYGLMQIVPQSAGQDASALVHGEATLLSPSYLYDSNKNIEMGVAYIHILYYRYLKSINDPVSRLYCTIAAYNTGAGNVAKAFTSGRNIKKASKTINQMSSDKVYQHLIKHLPYAETRNYLQKVNRLLPKYFV